MTALRRRVKVIKGWDENMGSMIGKRGEMGMTLIEVMLASTILSVGLAVLLTGASRCMTVIHRAKNYQTAQWTLNIGELEYPMTDTNDVMNLAIGPIEYENGFSFERIVEEDDDEDNLFLVRTKVTWLDRGRSTTEEVIRYMLQAEK